MVGLGDSVRLGSVDSMECVWCEVGDSVRSGSTGVWTVWSVCGAK